MARHNTRRGGFETRSCESSRLVDAVESATPLRPAHLPCHSELNKRGTGANRQPPVRPVVTVVFYPSLSQAVNAAMATKPKAGNTSIAFQRHGMGLKDELVARFPVRSRGTIFVNAFPGCNASRGEHAAMATKPKAGNTSTAFSGTAWA